jgi:regulator of sirC expression with transglutaminase-like and TPR domain
MTTMDFSEYAAQPDAELDLLTGALLVARDAYPALDLAEQLQRVEELAAGLDAERVGGLPPALGAPMLLDYLHRREGFRGNRADYYDPRNSFLNEVLERRLGIPISLSVVYVAVARRAGLRATGMGFPGHFLLRIDGEGSESSVIVDPFHGELLEVEDLKRLLERISPGLELEPDMLTPASVRQVIARLLMNLRGIYATRADYPRLLVVLDRLIDLLPEVADELRDRGLLWAKLGAPEAALDDLRRYVTALPYAGDVAEVRRLIDRLETGLPSAN